MWYDRGYNTPGESEWLKKTGLSGSLSGDCLSDLYLRGSHSSMVSAFYEYRIDNAHRHYHGFISRYSVSHSRRSDRCCFWPCSWRGRNVDSSVSASILMFLFIRYGYQEWGERVLHRHNSLGKITVLFEKKCVCDDPVYPVDSFYTLDHCKCLFGFKRVSFAAYATASSLGKIPSMLLFAWIGDSLMTEPENIVVTIAVYSIFLAVTLSVHQRWRKNRAPEMPDQEMT